MKMMNREFRKTAGLPCNTIKIIFKSKLFLEKKANIKIYLLLNYLVGVSSNPCPCCKKVEKRKHECNHEFCETNCPKKRSENTSALADMLPANLSFLLNQQNNPLKKKILQGGKPVIFGLKTKEDETSNINNSNLSLHNPGMLFDSNVDKENSAINLNSIFSSAQGKNPIFISNTSLPNTNLFKSVQVPQGEQTKNTNNSADSGNNINMQEKSNGDKTQNVNNFNNANANNDKKFFFMVKK